MARAALREWRRGVQEGTSARGVTGAQCSFHNSEVILPPKPACGSPLQITCDRAVAKVNKIAQPEWPQPRP